MILSFIGELIIIYICSVCVDMIVNKRIKIFNFNYMIYSIFATFVIQLYIVYFHHILFLIISLIILIFIIDKITGKFYN